MKGDIEELQKVQKGQQNFASLFCAISDLLSLICQNLKKS